MAKRHSSFLPAVILAALLPCAIRATSIGVCQYNVHGPLRPQDATTCPRLIDHNSDKTKSTEPWSHFPSCISAIRNATSGEEGIYCLYTSTDFRSGRGISIITEPEVAADVVGKGAISSNELPVYSPFRPEPSAAPAYKIVDILGRGKGVVATRKIRPEEIFMIDYPALVLSQSLLEHVPAHHRRRLVKKGLKQLSNETGDRIHALHRKNGNYLLDDILAPNAINNELAGDKGHMMLFLDFSRVNHDCQPNAWYRFSATTLALELYSYRTIQPGEEITISYTPLRMPGPIRREFLKETWNVTCNCGLCHMEESAARDSESRRRRVNELERAVGEATAEQYYENALEIAREWGEVADEEGIPLPMGQWHDTVARLSLRAGLLSQSVKHARLALDSWTRVGSVDDADVEGSREFMRGVNKLDPEEIKNVWKGFPNTFKNKKY